MTNQTPSNSVVTHQPWEFDPEENNITCNGAPIFSVYRADDFPCIEDDERPAADMDYLAHAQVTVMVLNAIANAQEPTLGDTLRTLAMQSANTKGSDELDPGDPQDWADKLEELYGWTGSTWAEEQPEAYSFMCSLIGYLIAGHELALRVNAMATPDTDRVAVLTKLLTKSRGALQRMMDTWLDYHDAHSLTQPVTGASSNAFEDALEARDQIDAALSQPLGSQEIGHE